MVVQSSYSNQLPVGTPGGFGFERDKASVLSKEANSANGVEFGVGVALADTAGEQVRNMQSDQAVYVMDADFTSGNFTGNLTVNGTTTAFSIAFNTSHLQSQQDAETFFESVSGIASATISDANNRTMTLQADPDTDIYFDTLSASGVNFTESNGDSKGFYGISTQQENQPATAGGSKKYEDGEQVGVGRRAYLYMTTDSALNPGDDVYIRFFEEAGDDKKRGMLTNQAGSAPVKASLQAELWVEKGATAGNLALIGINLP